MNYGTHRDLLFLILPGLAGVIEAVTGWGIQDDAATLEYPEFPSGFPEEPPFDTCIDLEIIHTVFNALNELNTESRELKLASCREREKSKLAIASGHIPFEFSPSDYKFWARKSIWTPDEAALLSLGFVPTDSVVGMFEKLDDQSSLKCLLLKEFSERFNLIIDANRSGELNADGNPVDLLKWFIRLEFELPKGLAETVFRIQTTERFEKPSGVQESQYSDREKQTLLKLVAAMAVGGYGFNPASSRNPATKDIQSDLDQLGIGLDQKTILKWLREAANNLPDDRQD